MLSKIDDVERQRGQNNTVILKVEEKRNETDGDVLEAAKKV
jgi:hypothetical protein